MFDTLRRVTDGGREAESVEVVLESGEHALTIHLSGTRFDGGRLPLSALSTLDKMNAMVSAIARDLDVAMRTDGTRVVEVRQG